VIVRRQSSRFSGRRLKGRPFRPGSRTLASAKRPARLGARRGRPWALGQLLPWPRGPVTPRGSGYNDRRFV